MFLSYKYRIYPHFDQAKKLEQWMSLCCALYNAALEQRQKAWRLGKSLGWADQQLEIKEVRTLPGFDNVPGHVLRDALKRLDKAFQNFFGRCKKKVAKVGYPRFKPRASYFSLTSPDPGNYIRENRLYFPKMSPIRVKMHRPLPDGAKVKTATIKKTAAGWFVFLAVEVATSTPPPHPGQPLGIDVGLKHFLTASFGGLEYLTVEPHRFLRNAEKRLKRAQRSLSRKQKGSNNRRKQRHKVALLHSKVVNQRNDFQWKVASAFAKECSIIYVEDLQIRNMVKNHCLAKAIHDASWGTFLTKLAHSCVKTGAKFVKVNPRNTSKTCSNCGWVWKAMTLEHRDFKCETCGLVLDRDINAAVNILKLGQDMPEVTPAETRSSTSRYRRKASSVIEAGTIGRKAETTTAT